ncbi:MAG: helix-turn-helix domain-containing protein [Dehalococcoidales bacterium]
MSQTKNGIGEIIKRRRISIPLTLDELSSNSGVSQSHIGRIERGERFPSARVLHRIAKPLGFKEEDLFMFAGFLSYPTNDVENSLGIDNYSLAIDPIVASTLSRESAEVQRVVIGILSLLKIMAMYRKSK